MIANRGEPMVATPRIDPALREVRTCYGNLADSQRDRRRAGLVALDQPGRGGRRVDRLRRPVAQRDDGRCNLRVASAQTLRWRMPVHVCGYLLRGSHAALDRLQPGRRPRLNG